MSDKDKAKSAVDKILRDKETALLHTKIQEYAQGTCKSESEIANDLETDEETVLEALAGSDVVRCESCDWWCEQCEMEEVDGEEHCEDCREK